MIQDTVLFEILSNRFQAIVDEMAQVVFRTAHTVFVKETQDFGAILVTLTGEVFAAPRRYGVLNVVGTPMDGAIAYIGDDVKEGDIFISNDPESTKGMATHLSDIYLWKPVFFEGELICFAWSFIHASDIGGRVPGSIAPSSYEVYQEGLIIPPRKLFRGGDLDEGLLDFILKNCRIPDQNWGDIKACVSGLNTAEKRLHELLKRYDKAIIKQAISDVLDYAEGQARRVIAHVPPGNYTFIDYLEGDMAGLGLVRIKLNLVIEGNQMVLDFTGTDPQVRAALNIPSYGKNGHSMLVTALVNWLCTREPAIAYNAGLVRPFLVKIPEGNLLRADPGAAYGARYSTSQKACDVTIGALAQAIPMELPAFDSGQGSILLVSIPDFDTGGTKVSVVQPIVGGSGARPNDDGIDGTMIVLNFLKNVPTESLENDMPPILIHHYGLRQDSGGPGHFRGGTGIEIELQTFSPYTTITSRCMERYIFPPPGRLGGSPGATGYTTLNPGSINEEDIGKIDILQMSVGDRLRIGTPGGGGFGDPLDRPIDWVELDVRNEIVSREAARKDYGLVFNKDLNTDREATQERRNNLRKTRNWTEPPMFSFGDARDVYQKRMNEQIEDAIIAAVAPFPPVLSRYMHWRLKGKVENAIATDENFTLDKMQSITDEIINEVQIGYPSSRTKK